MDCGDILGRYELVSLIARGGMAEVWLARAGGARGFRKKVVIKTILPHLAQDPEFIEMFRNEALLAAGLDHPHLVQIFDFGAKDSTYYIAMEYVDGQSLRQVSRLLRKEKKEAPPPWLALHVLAAACDGLQYAHGLRDEDGKLLGLVHRDVSPENIMISYEGTVKLLDFGVAKATKEASLTEAGTLKGKYSYMAPEQILGRPVDRRIDVYAAGVVLYEVLTGMRPFRGRTQWDLLQQITAGDVVPPTEYAPWIPKSLEELILKAIERDPDERFPSARHLQERILDHIDMAKERRGRRDVGEFMRQLFLDEKPESTEENSIMISEADILPTGAFGSDDLAEKEREGAEVWNNELNIETAEVALPELIEGERVEARKQEGRKTPPKSPPAKARQRPRATLARPAVPKNSEKAKAAKARAKADAAKAEAAKAEATKAEATKAEAAKAAKAEAARAAKAAKAEAAKTAKAAKAEAARVAKAEKAEAAKAAKAAKAEAAKVAKAEAAKAKAEAAAKAEAEREASEVSKASRPSIGAARPAPTSKDADTIPVPSMPVPSMPVPSASRPSFSATPPTEASLDKPAPAAEEDPDFDSSVSKSSASVFSRPSATPTPSTHSASVFSTPPKSEPEPADNFSKSSVGKKMAPSGGWPSASKEAGASKAKPSSFQDVVKKQKSWPKSIEREPEPEPEPEPVYDNDDEKSLATAWSAVVDRREVGETTARSRRKKEGLTERRQSPGAGAQGAWSGARTGGTGGGRKTKSKDSGRKKYTETNDMVSREERALEHFEKGLEFMRGGKQDAAIAEWKEAVKLDPESRTYQFNLDRVLKK